jgi:glycosyltransferase involved in cell wall biosynthesis
MECSRIFKEMKNPKVTVLMSVYNGEKYLKEAIDSILNQTFKDFEFLIINDGSTDRTKEILSSYDDSRIKIIVNEKNIGLTKSLNKGLKVAKGEYIARQDADDISTTERLRKEVDFLDNNKEYTVVGTFLNVMDENSKIIGKIDKPIENGEIKKFLQKDNCIAHGSAMIRKYDLLNVGLYDGSIEKAQDYELFLRISEKYKLYNIPEYLYIWRRSKDNISSKHLNEQRHYVVVSKVKNKKKSSNTNKPNFSVLMANYNNGEYIAEAIQSVINQTFEDWELVIVDDCSTDNSIERINPFLKDKRVRLLRNEKNQGYINTLNRLVYESEADIFGILDSDDVLLENALDIMYKKHKEYPDCGLIYSQFIFCDEKLNLLEKGFSNSIPSGKTSLYYNSVSAFRTFKKNVFFKTAGFDEDILYAEDKDIIFRIEEVTKLLFIDKVLYKHRILPNSQSHDAKKRMIGNISYITAKYNAYNRRLNINIPNLTKNEMSTQLFLAAAFCTKQRNLKKMIFFLLNAVKLDPFNFKGVKTYLKEVGKVIL